MIGLNEMIDRQQGIDLKSLDNESHSQFRISVNKSGIFDNMKASGNSDHEHDQNSSGGSQKAF